MRAGVARCKRAPVSGQRDVESEVMTAELNHPRLGGGRLSEERKVILIVADPAAACARFQGFIGLDNMADLFISPRTQGDFQQAHGRSPLFVRQVSHSQASPFDE